MFDATMEAQADRYEETMDQIAAEQREADLSEQKAIEEMNAQAWKPMKWYPFFWKDAKIQAGEDAKGGEKFVAKLEDGSVAILLTTREHRHVDMTSTLKTTNAKWLQETYNCSTHPCTSKEAAQLTQMWKYWVKRGRVQVI